MSTSSPACDNNKPESPITPLSSSNSLHSNTSPLLNTNDQHPLSNFLKCGVFVQGIGMLFPWNSLISNPDFFKSTLSHTTWVEPNSFPNWMAFTFQIATLCTTLYTLKPVGYKADRLRTVVCLCLNILVFFTLFSLATTAFSLDNQIGVNHDSLFLFILSLVLVSGISGAIIQSHLFAFTAQIHPKLTTLLLIGQGISGIAICLLQLILGVLEVGTGLASIIYYSASVLVLVVCLVFYKQTIYARACPSETSSPTDSSEPIDISPPRQLIQLVHHLKPYLFSIIFNFSITLSLFPGYTTLIRTDSMLNQTAFTALLFLIFNIGDTLGRIIPPHSFTYLIFKPWRPVLVASLSRAVLLPLFFMVPLNGVQSKLPAILTNSFFSILLVFIMAVSSGWVAKVCLADAPLSGTLDSSRALVGRVMTLGLLMGLTSGSLLGFWVVGSD